MNTEEIATKLMGYLETTAGFVSEQAPLFAQEIVAWGVWSNGILGALCYLTAGVCMYFTHKWGKLGIALEKERGNGQDGFLQFMGACLFGLLGLGLITLATFEFLPDFIKASVAPRVYLLDYARGLM